MPRDTKGDIARVNIYMSYSLRDYFKEYAEVNGISMSGVMVMALRHFQDSQKALYQVGAMNEMLVELKKITASEKLKENPLSE